MVESEQLIGGQLNAALADAIVQIHNQYLGRGPSKGQAFFRDRCVVVVMEETLTKAERSLIDSGHEDHVLAIRQEFQRTMENDVIEAVQSLTGCKVLAYMSDNHIDPDVAAELFLLDRAVPGESAGSGGGPEPNGDAGDR